MAISRWEGVGLLGELEARLQLGAGARDCGNSQIGKRGIAVLQGR